MKRKVNKTLSVFLVLFILISSCLSLITNAETDEYYDNGQMDLDVVFVLDASGSMLSSDPNRVAIDAFNLFTDLCDGSCGVGYSVYTHKLKASSPIVSLDDKKNLEKLKKNISNIEYDPNGSTDIALGLTKAMNIHSENKSSDSNRKKAIILLSDGNTYLEGGPRTVAESNKEMQSTLKTLNSQNIPVYSIGLNYDGTLDKKELKKISDSTKGKTYETTTSDDLISIISDIFSDIYKLQGTECEIKDGNVKINIKNNSVFYVNVIIKSRFTQKELNPVLTSPDGKEVSLTDNENIKVTGTGSYTLIKMIYPDSGTWNLHLDKADSSNCQVTQLDFYSIYIKQKINKSVKVGDSVKIEASIRDGDGVVDDYDLLKTIEMTTVVSSKDGEQTITLTKGSGGIYTGEFTPDSEGEYSIKTIAKSKTFEKESSTFKLNAVIPIEPSVISEVSASEGGGIGLAILSPILITIGIAIIVTIVIIIIVVIVRASIKSKAEYVTEEPAKPMPKPEPPKPVQPMPKPKDPDYVDIPIVKHDDLELLIKKGPEDAFNTKASDYKADPNLEKLIKKGADDPFKTNGDDYKVDPKLASLIHTGEKGLDSQENSNNETQSKVSLEKNSQPKVNLKKDDQPKF